MEDLAYFDTTERSPTLLPPFAFPINTTAATAASVAVTITILTRLD